jgi:O-6-methylguanine DNA methyltransferase
MSLTSLKKTVYNLLRKIPKGRVVTYKILARAVGKPKNWRQIGRILSQNPYPQKFPCYKVVKSNGEIGGYRQGPKKKIAFLKRDGIIVRGNKIRDLKKILFNF